MFLSKLSALNSIRNYSSKIWAKTWELFSLSDEPHERPGTSTYGQQDEEYWADVVMSSDGNKFVAVEYKGYFYYSYDYGDNHSPLYSKDPDNNREYMFKKIAGSGDLGVLIFSTKRDNFTSGKLIVSTDGGNTWSKKIEVNNEFDHLAVSTSGQYQVISSGQLGTGYDKSLRISNDYGNSWTTKNTAITMSGVSISRDGSKIVASAGGSIFISTDYGNNFSQKNVIAQSIQATGLSDIKISADGTFIAVPDNIKRRIYISKDLGETWSISDIVHGSTNATTGSFKISQDGGFIIWATKNASNLIISGTYYPEGAVFASSDFGATFHEVRPSTWQPGISDSSRQNFGEYTRHWVTAAMSDDGTKIILLDSLPTQNARDIDGPWTTGTTPAYNVAYRLRI